MKSKELEKVLELMNSRPVAKNLTFQEWRTETEAVPGFPLAEDVKCEKVDAAGVPAEWITTSDSADSQVILYLHGGGYVVGSIYTHREMASRLSRAAKAKAILIDYRLAPENPFPAAVEDATAVYRWLLSIGVKPARIVIAGDSAGGGLAVATMVSIRDAGEKLPAAAVCISPWVDLACSSESIVKNTQNDEMLTLEHLLNSAKAYLRETDPRMPLASPVYADLSMLPPILIQVGTAEELLDDAKRLSECAKAYGVDVTLETWDDMFHVWHSFAAMLPEGQQAIERIGTFVRKHMS